jgi:hypothetical protein
MDKLKKLKENTLENKNNIFKKLIFIINRIIFNKKMFESNNNDKIEIPIKKKKGRKSKQTKILELEEMEKNKVPIKLFPTLNEKIFDVINIDCKEYYLDTDFGIIYNDEINQIGIKKNDKYILYSELEYKINELNQQLEFDHNQIIQMSKLYS